MPHVQADRVRDTITTTGTGVLTVSGTAPLGYRTFSAVCAVGDTVHYAIQHQTAGEWEVGVGTYSASNQITRTTILSSSNAGAAVNLSAGTKDIFITPTATGIVYGSGYSVLTSAIVTVTGTSRTLSAADNGKVLYFTSASAVTLTTATGLGAGFTCTLIQGGAGVVTVAEAASTTRVSLEAANSLAGQYAMATIFCPVANTFILAGQLA